MSNLQEAFREAARREFAMVPAEEALDYTFSPGFQRKMRRIIRAQAHGYWQLVNTTAKRIACIAAIIMMLLTTAMAIKPVRERVIKFFVEVYEEYFSVTFGEEENRDLERTPTHMELYSFSYLPDGFYLTNRIATDSFYRTDWQKREGYPIILLQEPASHNIVIDNNGTSLIDLSHNDLSLLYYHSEDTYVFLWEQYECIFHLTIYEKLTLDEILEMIDSLRIE